MMRQEDLTDEEMEYVLFDDTRGKFWAPDFPSILEGPNIRLYDAWIHYFRTASGRPHFPRSFYDAYQKWLQKQGSVT